MDDKTAPHGRLRQLDALRAFACLAVVAYHIILQDPALQSGMARLTAVVGGAPFDLGYHGVQLFFYLSGFLITRILLRSRDTAESGGSKSSAWVQFEARRVFRIFPLYYGLIAVYALVWAGGGVGWFGEVWPELVTYRATSVIQAGGELGTLGHFWTLGIEEYFYLAWPAFMLFAPRRSLVPIMVLAALVSGLTRVGAHLIGAGTWIADGGQLWQLSDGKFVVNFMARGFVPQSFFLIVGSLLGAVFDSRVATLRRWQRGLQLVLAPTLLASVWVWALFGFAIYDRWNPAFVGSLSTEHALAMQKLGVVVFEVVAYSVLVVLAATGVSGGVTARVFDLRGLHWVGERSYGIYVFHVPILHALYGFVPLNAAGTIGRAAFFIAVTFVVAEISWRIFERPLNTLKERWFGYAPAGRDRVGDAARTA
jgi:peptidoglycan/LPS O-acetylase OafA/YrhL